MKAFKYLFIAAMITLAPKLAHATCNIGNVRFIFGNSNLTESQYYGGNGNVNATTLAQCKAYVQFEAYQLMISEGEVKWPWPATFNAVVEGNIVFNGVSHTISPSSTITMTSYQICNYADYYTYGTCGPVTGYYFQPANYNIIYSN